jgi:hypothetical protein
MLNYTTVANALRLSRVVAFRYSAAPNGLPLTGADREAMMTQLGMRNAAVGVRCSGRVGRQSHFFGLYSDWLKLLTLNSKAGEPC